MLKKPKIAIVSLTSCEGCQFAILDLGEKFLEILEKFDLGEFRLLEEEKEPDYYEIVFVEGNPTSQQQINFLKEVRRKSKLLTLLGNCAALGGVQEIKNYQDREKTIRYIYKYYQKIPNPEIKEVSNFVKVDFILPGCPINGQEFLDFLESFLKGKKFEIKQRPVCFECSLKGEKCFLKNKKICLGPISLAGCQAICPAGGLSCYGCRGLFKEANISALLNILEKFISKKEIKTALEIFGLRDEVEEKLKKKL